MAKIITVWGSPGSGKSMFCCMLAKALTRDKRKAIIVNADNSVPMLPVCCRSSLSLLMLQSDRF